MHIDMGTARIMHTTTARLRDAMLIITVLLLLTVTANKGVIYIILSNFIITLVMT